MTTHEVHRQKAMNERPRRKTAFETYFGGILAGDIVACEKMRLVSKRLMEAYENPGLYHFSPRIAARHTRFIERFCKIPSGRWGRP